MERQFLPMSRAEMRVRGWDGLDFVLVTGDAYVDHPSFGAAIIGRVLERAGYRVGVISQPDWRNPESVKTLGQPALAFLVTSGNMDSMVNHYSVSKRRRKTDQYSPGGRIGKRPDRAVIVYTNLIKQAYRHIPVVIGGIEASLRRLAHYDYWEDRVRRSVLYDSGADLLVYGMAEHQILEIAEYLSQGIGIEHIHHLPGTCYLAADAENLYDHVMLPSFAQVEADPKAFARFFREFQKQQDPMRGKTLVQPHDKGVIVQNPPAIPLNETELDYLYELPFVRDVHPAILKQGPVPAIEEVRFSIVSNRGCFGSCSFCALTFHQGRAVQSRSTASMVREAKDMIQDPHFKGYIHDVGGPTANFQQPACDRQLTTGACANRQCLYPERCPELKVDHSRYLETLRQIRKLDGVKKVFIRSGIRYDYLMYDRREVFEEIVRHHVSGQLKVAPEHIDPTVLKFMGKPDAALYRRFVDTFHEITRKVGKEQYIIPYLISSHPGSTLQSAIRLAEYLRDIRYTPEQVQDFYPTPGTLSTCMYHTGLDPRDLSPVHVPKQPREKQMQRALLQFRNPRNHAIVREALVKAHREDLIGYGKNCLVPPGDA